MKSRIYILFTVFLFALSAQASTGIENPKNQPLEERQQPKQEIVPKSEEVVEKPVGSPQFAPPIISEETIIQESDSSYNSLSKFNFIFYFFYKFKYDDSDGSSLNAVVK
ncbi:MAG: hypothetical protein KI790_01010 [Cyclobacteriaceae bacterium]|nr:hypothetical protein [Cyclobacteriaceae bacterium HetDA_MAG_MS6]